MEIFSFILLLSILVFGYGLFSELLLKWYLSGPMIFCMLGILVQSVISVEGFSMEGGGIELLAEITLISILFTDASSVSLKDFFRLFQIPSRLLFLGLPLTIFLGLLISTAIFSNIGLWSLFLLALILTPTDAALGQAFITNKKVPFRFREAINVESGLNDGMVLPLILLALTFLEGSETEYSLQFFLSFFGMQLFFGPIIGGLVGWAGGRVVEYASNRKWMNKIFQSISSISIAIIAYGAAEHIGGNGYIAAFFAGLFLGTNTPIVRNRIQEFGESLGGPFSLIIFFLFGLIFIPWSFPYLNFLTLSYSILSLTIIRMIPVFISLLGSKLNLNQKLFLGWSGPRGIASILYLIIAIKSIGIEGYEIIYAVIIQTVFLSIFLHGFSALPYANWFGKKYPENSPTIH